MDLKEAIGDKMYRELLDLQYDFDPDRLPEQELDLQLDDVLGGVLWLDETVPTWRSEVDESKLQLQFCDQCVIGQVLKARHSGMVFVPIRWPAEFGVETETPVGWLITRGFDTRPGASYETLTELWRFVLVNDWHPEVED